MTPFEALYRRTYSYPVGRFEVGESLLLCPEVIYKPIEKVQIIRHGLKEAYSRQNSYVDDYRRKNL